MSSIALFLLRKSQNDKRKHFLTILPQCRRVCHLFPVSKTTILELVQNDEHPLKIVNGFYDTKASQLLSVHELTEWSLRPLFWYI
jgi:hypothetical protein